MAYVSGTASSFTDLLTQLTSAITANGWAKSFESPTASIVKKDGVVIRMGLATYSSKLCSLEITGGTSSTDGSDSLVGSSPQRQTVLGSIPQTTGAGFKLPQIIDNFPLTFHVFVNHAPEEVTVVINYATNYFQGFGFGKSVFEMPAGGTGAFIWASSRAGDTVKTSGGAKIGNAAATQVPTVVGSESYSRQCGMPFFSSSTDTALNSSSTGGRGAHLVHTNIVPGTVSGWESPSNVAHTQSLLRFGISEASTSPILCPIKAYSTGYAANTYAPVLDLAHLRHLDMSVSEPLDVITLGTDEWMLFPALKHNPGESITAGLSDSDYFQYGGRLGYAVRKTA